MKGIRSNCHQYAWGQFVEGKAVWIRFGLTEHRFACRFAHRRLWLWTLAPVGIFLQWFGTYITVLGWYARWGKVYHTHYSRDGENWYAYEPIDKEFFDKPWTGLLLWFRGQVNKVQ